MTVLILDTIISIDLAFCLNIRINYTIQQKVTFLQTQQFTTKKHTMIISQFNF